MMIKNIIRTIGIAIFIAGATLSLANMKGESTKINQSTVSQTEQIKKLKADNNLLKDDIAALQQKASIAETPKNKGPIRYTLEVKSGMGTSEVSKLLAKERIIKDANVFEAYIINEGKSSALQLGKSELTDSMSQEEILNTIIKRK